VGGGGGSAGDGVSRDFFMKKPLSETQQAEQEAISAAIAMLQAIREEVREMSYEAWERNRRGVADGE
jgi:hypothetical protein